MPAAVAPEMCIMHIFPIDDIVGDPLRDAHAVSCAFLLAAAHHVKDLWCAAAADTCTPHDACADVYA